jgi:hypothetical protein
MPAACKVHAAARNRDVRVSVKMKLVFANDDRGV